MALVANQELHTDVLGDLLRILATVDATFTPWRIAAHNGATTAAIYERRQDYVTRGVALESGAAANAMARSRRLGVLRRLGFVTTAGRMRDLRVRLTPAGEDFARQRAPVCCLFDKPVWALLKRLAEPLPDDVTQGGFVHERSLAGIAFEVPAKESNFHALEDCALPLLVRGWIDSHSDARLSVGYQITSKGRQALEQGKPTKPQVDPFDSAIGETYAEHYLRLLTERESWAPEGNNHVVVPLSCGLWSECSDTVNPASK